MLRLLSIQKGPFYYDELCRWNASILKICFTLTQSQHNFNSYDSLSACTCCERLLSFPQKMTVPPR